MPTGLRLSAIALAAAVAGVTALTLLPSSIELRPARADPARVMEAACYDEAGDASAVRLCATHPRPVPRPDQIMIAVRFASVNPVDFKVNE